MNKPPIAPLLAALCLALASCGGGGAPAEGDAEPPLAGAKIGGPFTLTDQQGRRFSSASLKGEYRLIYFGYTYCPDICPLDMQNLMGGLIAFEKDDPRRAAHVQPVFISIDPERDTPDVLDQYADAFHPRLIALTGSGEEIADVARRYGVYYRKGDPRGGSEYDLDHSRQAYLFGPEGEPIALLPQDESPEAVEEALDRYVS